MTLRCFCPQAIAHYEQAADYYKGEESNRQVAFTEGLSREGGRGGFVPLLAHFQTTHWWDAHILLPFPFSLWLSAPLMCCFGSHFTHRLLQEASRGARVWVGSSPGHSSSLEAVDCSSANKCLLKVAAYAAQLEQYQKAIEIYEQVRMCRIHGDSSRCQGKWVRVGLNIPWPRSC